MKLDETLELEWKHIRNRSYLRKVLNEQLSDYKGGRIDIAIKGRRDDIDELAVAELAFVYGSIVDIYRKNQGTDEMKIHIVSYSSLDKGLPAKIKINLDSLFEFECIPEEYHKRKVEKKMVLPPEEKIKPPWDEVRVGDDRIIVSWNVLIHGGTKGIIERYCPDYKGQPVKLQISGKGFYGDGALALAVFVSIYTTLIKKAEEKGVKSQPDLKIILTAEKDKYLVQKTRDSCLDQIFSVSYEPQQHL